MDRILLPVDFPDTPLSVVRQTAFLARHFHSEVILLHVVAPLGIPEGALESAREALVQSVLDGIRVRRLVRHGDPAREILRTATAEQADLIAISTRGHGMLYRLLLGSVTAKVLHSSECPVWSNAPTDDSTASDFAIRRILCAVDLTPHSCHTIARAAEWAAEFGASLTLVHITAGANSFGPGGDSVDLVWKQSFVRFAAEEIAKLQQQAGTDAEVLIDCGDVHELLKRAAQQLRADLLVIGHMPPGGHLGQNGSGYSLIRDSQVPVLSL